MDVRLMVDMVVDAVDTDGAVVSAAIGAADGAGTVGVMAGGSPKLREPPDQAMHKEKPSADTRTRPHVSACQWTREHDPMSVHVSGRENTSPCQCT